MTLSVKDIFQSLVEHELSVPKIIPTQEPNYKPDTISIVSLFCGAGGIDLGFESAGVEIALNSSIDYFNEYYLTVRNQSIAHTSYALDFCAEAVETFKNNFEDSTVQLANIRQLKHFPFADIYSFGFPCQGFSSAGPRNLKDERNFLYVHCCRALQEAQPKFFFAENVPGLLTLQNGAIFKQIQADFKECGYRIYWKVVNSRDFGCAQIRERVYIIGVRVDIDYHYEFPKSTHGTLKQPFLTLKECIGDLPEDDNYYIGSYSSQYMSRNRKKEWHEQSFTIQASARQSPLHPSSTMKRLSSTNYELVGACRRLTVREAARIQSFPDWFDFSYGNNNDIQHNTRIDKQFKQVGNAVSPLVMKHLSKPVLLFLKQANL